MTQIGYFLVTATILARTAEIIQPGVIPILAHETLNMKNERKTIQYRRENLYKNAVSKREIDMRKLKEDFDQAMGTLKDQVSDIIKYKLNIIENGAEVVIQRTNKNM